MFGRIGTRRCVESGIRKAYEIKEAYRELPNCPGDFFINCRRFLVDDQNIEVKAVPKYPAKLFIKSLCQSNTTISDRRYQPVPILDFLKHHWAKHEKINEV